MTKLVDSKYVWWFFAATTIFVYSYGLGLPLVGPDEPRYAQVAREMFERGDWITPTLGGFEWFEKPALLYWLQIVSYKLFGVNEFGARFGSALFGLGTMSSMWLLGRYSNFEDNKAKAVEFANLLALVTATTLGIFVFARGASFDIIVTFPLTASLVGFFIADRAKSHEHRKHSIGLIAFYLFAGVAVLAKGLIGIVFPFAIVGLYFLISRRFPSRKFFVSLAWGIPLLVAIAAIWNLPMYLLHGWKFIDEFYIQHHFQRYTSNKYQHPQPFYFYFWVLPLMTLPWTPWLFGGIFNSVRSFFEKANGPDNLDSRALSTFAAAWIVIPIIFFSVSGSKLPGYILPVVPAAAIFASIILSKFVKQRSPREYLVFAVAILMLALIPIALLTAAPRYFDKESIKRLIAEADSSGHGESKIAGFRTVSHSAEFYAAGRLVREPNGKQKVFGDPNELRRLASQEDQPILVLAPVERRSELIDRDCLGTFEIANNDDLAIFAVRSLCP